MKLNFNEIDLSKEEFSTPEICAMLNLQKSTCIKAINANRFGDKEKYVTKYSGSRPATVKRNGIYKFILDNVDKLKDKLEDEQLNALEEAFSLWKNTTYWQKKDPDGHAAAMAEMMNEWRAKAEENGRANIFSTKRRSEELLEEIFRLRKSLMLLLKSQLKYEDPFDLLYLYKEIDNLSMLVPDVKSFLNLSIEKLLDDSHETSNKEKEGGETNERDN